MPKSALRDKDKKVLNLIVESYVRDGKPVSSGSIAQTGETGMSSATVRNIMAKLEGLGYLHKPHTSAGRVPTDKGLQFYAGSLLAETLYSPSTRAFARGELSPKTADFDSLLIETSRVLADSSDNLGFVISPHVSRVPFEHVRFIRISSRKIMVILVAPFHLVLTDTLDTEIPMTQVELDRAAQYINQNFIGRTLTDVRDVMLQELPRYRAKYEDTINKLIDLVKATINRDDDESRIFIQGAARLLDKPELFDMAKLKSLFRNFEEKANLVRLLSDFISLGEVKVLIGAELNFPDIQDCSLVLSHYGTDNQVLGSLGILGPKRIPYERIIPLVDRVAKRLSRAITAFGREVS